MTKAQIQAGCRAQKRKEHSSKGSRSGGGERLRACFLAVEDGWLQPPDGEAGQMSEQEKVFLQSELMSRETPLRSWSCGQRPLTRRASEQLGQESSTSLPCITPTT